MLNSLKKFFLDDKIKYYVQIHIPLNKLVNLAPPPAPFQFCDALSRFMIKGKLMFLIEFSESRLSSWLSACSKKMGAGEHFTPLYKWFHFSTLVPSAWALEKIENR